MRLFGFILVIIGVLLASSVHGHGVSYGIFPERAFAVRFVYAGGEPMSYVKVRVFGPQNSLDLEFQNGRTDARGVFAFVPDRSGSWMVEAWDESGHKGSFKVPVVQNSDAERKITGQLESTASGPGVAKVILGLSLIANLAFGVALFRSSKNSRRGTKVLTD